MTTQSEQESSGPSRTMKCLSRLYVLEDEAGLTWLAVEGLPPSPVEGGAMSHRSGSGDADPAQGEGDVQGGGAMSHLVPGETTEIEGDDRDRVTVLVPGKPGLLPHRMQAYRVSPALLPTGSEPGSG